ncbi:MAG: hypothetical protein HKN04_12460 [Rhodothermaceae bacterium]|nr:hypothetical protein [Rhodothermaceae bacterium]
MARNILAVVAGFVAWTVVFLGLAAVIRALFPDAYGPDGAVIEALPLLLVLVGSFIASVIAGYATARLATSDEARYVLVQAFLLLVVGLFVEISSWELTPAWYHIVFLLSLVPLTLVGGRLGGAR